MRRLHIQPMTDDKLYASNPVHIISLGAGVQSSTMSLMAAKGEIIPMPTCAIFADTQAEPKKVYEWLDWLEKQLPFPVYRVTKGNLAEDELRIRRSQKSGRLYLKNSIPAFVLNPNGAVGLLGRRCTSDYKIIPLQRKIREITGVKRSGKGIVEAIVWIGISTDEAHRMKDSRVDYIQNSWPLIKAGFSRRKCLDWMTQSGYPEPPRSACKFCPFHSDEEWNLIKKNQAEWEDVIGFEDRLQKAAGCQEVLKGVPFLHSSCSPIGSVVFNSPKGGYQQLSMFGNECEGMCGV